LSSNKSYPGQVEKYLAEIKVILTTEQSVFAERKDIPARVQSI